MHFTNFLIDAHLSVVVKVLVNDMFNSLLHRHDKKRYNLMGKEIKIWYDKEGDYLEVPNGRGSMFCNL